MVPAEEHRRKRLIDSISSLVFARSLQFAEASLKNSANRRKALRLPQANGTAAGKGTNSAHWVPSPEVLPHSQQKVGPRMFASLEFELVRLQASNSSVQCNLASCATLLVCL